MVLTAFFVGPICHLVVLLMHCPLVNYRSFAASEFSHSTGRKPRTVSTSRVVLESICFAHSRSYADPSAMSTSVRLDSIPYAKVYLVHCN
ncbi:hypothetical protein EDD15DRAFT_2258355, partial [Pisolithus albus]